MDERPVTRYPIMDMSSVTGAMQYTRFPQAGEANPIVRVGVVAVTGGETKWMDTGANTDVYLARVNWLPDGQAHCDPATEPRAKQARSAFRGCGTGRVANNSDGVRQILGQSSATIFIFSLTANGFCGRASARGFATTTFTIWLENSWNN